MFGHCRQPSGIAAGSPTYAGITPAGNLTLTTSSLRSSSGTTPACRDYHRSDHNRPDPVPTRSPPLRHTRRANQCGTNTVKTTSIRTERELTSLRARSSCLWIAYTVSVTHVCALRDVAGRASADMLRRLHGVSQAGRQTTCRVVLKTETRPREHLPRGPRSASS